MGTPIRLTDERWQHIVGAHPEMSGRRTEVVQTITEADGVVLGSDGAHIAFRIMEAGKAIVVVYREMHRHDGFVITAFTTRRLAALARRITAWPPQN